MTVVKQLRIAVSYVDELGVEHDYVHDSDGGPANVLVVREEDVRPDGSVKVSLSVSGQWTLNPSTKR